MRVWRGFGLPTRSRSKASADGLRPAEVRLVAAAARQGARELPASRGAQGGRLLEDAASCSLTYGVLNGEPHDWRDGTCPRSGRWSGPVLPPAATTSVDTRHAD